MPPVGSCSVGACGVGNLALGEVSIAMKQSYLVDGDRQSTIRKYPKRILYNESQSMERMVPGTVKDQLSTISTPKMVVEAVPQFFELGTPNAYCIESEWAPLSVEQIAVAHSRKYVEDVLSLRQPNGFGYVLQSSAEALPWESASFYHAAKWAVQNDTYAMSPTGAFHHAGYAAGSGFCTFNGLIIAAMLLKRDGLVDRIGIVDFDVHYPNGTMNLINTHELNWIKQINFFDEVVRNDCRHVRRWISDLPDKLGRELADVDLLLYQAGADAHVDDPAGGYLTTQDLEMRDFSVFSFAKANRIPVAWNLSGGYQKDLAAILHIHLNTFFVAMMMSY